jgi:prepilin-type N-terminal cleavage/methylation domain-containing protein/prepilin-type processing-associated H-X9-DG protein
MTAHRRRPRRPRPTGFTLLELLVVISIIGMLASIITPSLGNARELAHRAVCLSRLRDLGTAMGVYFSGNDHHLWPYKLYNHPAEGVHCYFWGTDADPVDPTASPFMNCAGDTLAALWCPSLRWGDYVPQGAHVSEPTTTYAYNGRYLDPALNGTTCKPVTAVPEPAELFVLADSGMAWAPAGVTIFQNSTYLEPVTGMWMQTPTNHFRHLGKTNVLLADGHARSFGGEGWQTDPGDVAADYDLGFVGTQNDPHYEQ